MIFYYYCLFKFIIFYPFLKVGRSETGKITMEYSHMKSLQQHSKSSGLTQTSDDLEIKGSVN